MTQHSSRICLFFVVVVLPDFGGTAEYTYNTDGLRLSKTYDGETVEYQWSGSKLAAEYREDKYIVYLMDESGNPYGMRVFDASDLSTTDYYYERNLQGDIIAITNAYGSVLGRYTYGAWGELLYVRDANYSTIITDPDHIANINALRYKGYYYDTETGLYYLQSRYYDPVVKRFVNADGLIESDSLVPNLFAYCGNNPVNYNDSSGYWKNVNTDLWQAEKGDSLWGLAVQETGNGANWTQFGYLGDSTKLKVGQHIRISASAQAKFTDLGGGWGYRLDRGSVRTHEQRHVHLYYKGSEYTSQNIDGQPKHKKTYKEPPNSVKKKLKEAIGWDWDGNVKSYSRHTTNIAANDSCGWIMGKCTCATTDYSFLLGRAHVPSPSGSYSIPLPIHSTAPAISPYFGLRPILVY